MVADSTPPYPPFTFPRLTPSVTAPPMAVTCRESEQDPPATVAGQVVEGTMSIMLNKNTKEVTAQEGFAPQPERSYSLPTSAPTTDQVVTRDPPSRVRRGSLLRRRSGDFSLPVQYKYVVIPGNNSRAILAAFRRRPWWGPARKDENATLNDVAAVFASSVQSRKRRSRGGRNGVKATAVGYNNKAFNLWWEMYASSPVIEATNLDANVRQAVNHFEFNAALVSKKGLYQSLRSYCDRGGVPTISNIVPKTFYLSGGAPLTMSGAPRSSRGDEKMEFLAYCVAMSEAEATSHAEGAAGEASAPVHGSSNTVNTCDPDGSGAINHNAAMPQARPNSGGTEDPVSAADGCDEMKHPRGDGASSSPVTDESAVAVLKAETKEDAEEMGERVDPDIVGTTRNASKDSASTKNSTSTGISVSTSNNDNHESGRLDGDHHGGAKLGDKAGRTPTWVVKPAANSNCGFGIQVCCSMKEVLRVVDATDNKAGRSGWVVQRYIERPLLVRRRKFDIRLFALIVADPSTRSWRRRSKSSATPKTMCSSEVNSKSNSKGSSSNENVGNGSETLQDAVESAAELVPVGEEEAEMARNEGRDRSDTEGIGPCPITAWCHLDAYVRTSSVNYSNDPSKANDKFVHLTNNAVQRRSPSYGQEEPGNKLTLGDLQEWLNGSESPHQGNAVGWVENTLRPRMHELVSISVAAAASAGINKRGRPYAFELLGYDFMVDDDLRVWLIEVNSNPCLEFVCPLLQGMISRVIDDTLSVALDPVFRPPRRHRSESGSNSGGHARGGGGFSRVYPVA